MKKIIIAAFLAALTACTSVDVKTTNQKMPVVTAPTITPMNMRPVNFGLTKLNNQYYYTLTSDNFGNLDNNIIEMRRYILSQKASINFYKTLSESTEISDTAKKKK